MTRRSASNAAAALLLVLAALTAASAQETAAPAPEPPAPPAPAAEAPFREFKLYVQNWAWDPETLRVAVGTRVILYVHSFDASRTRLTISK